MKKRYAFTVKLWKYPGEKAAWFFVSVPKKDSERIKKEIKIKRGWGSVRVHAKIGSSKWNTSIFPDSQSGAYLLPVKASVRRAEGLDEGEPVQVSIEIQ